MQQPESSSNSHSDDNIDPAVPAVPSWDEFNTNQGSSSNHAEEDDENGEHASLSHPLEPLCSVEEFGPVPPQGLINQDRNPESSIPYAVPSPLDIQFDGVYPEDPSPKSNVESRIIGPQIPSFLKATSSSKNDEFSLLPSLNSSGIEMPESSSAQKDECSNDLPPATPTIIGPSLPAEDSASPRPSAIFQSIGNELIMDEDTNISLPPEEPQSDDREIFPNKTNGSHIEENKGQFLPTNSDDDDEIVGPKPPTENISADDEQSDYVNRLIDFNMKKESSSNGIKREEWMLELPKNDLKQSYGLTAKSAFSKAPGSSAAVNQIRDLWTSTPSGAPGTSSSNKQKQDLHNKEAETLKFSDELDQVEEQRASIMNKDRSESLLEIHQKKRKIADESGSNSSAGRRPFDRDRDLKSSRGPSMSAEEAKEKMALDNRFGHGSTRKFL